MPANKNAMTRYALIDRMLANRNKAFSIQDITDALAEKLPEFGQTPVSKRCVEKDINYLQYDSPFDAEIEEYWVVAADKNDRAYRKRCLRYVDPTFSIFKPKLTDDEKSVLAASLETLGSFDGLENFEWLSDLTKRLNMEEHTPVISMSKNLLSNSTMLARLFTVIRLRQVITLVYHTFSNTRIRRVDVSPQLLKEYNNRWFLIACACDTGAVLTFALDRIDDFSFNYTLHYISAQEDLEERYEDIVGVTYDPDASIYKIIFWASDASLNYVRTKPIHGSQKQLRGDKEILLRESYPKLLDGAFFQIECKENYELIRELMAFSENLVVISPHSIVQKIKERLSVMINRYSNR